MKRPSTLACLMLALALPAYGGAPDVNEGLRDAAMRGDLAAVKSFLGKGAEVNAASEFGATALIFAADRGHLEVVKALLAGGADVNKKDTTYESAPIVWAAYNGHADVVSYLLQQGSTGADDTLGMAIERDQLEVVKALLASGKVSKEALGSSLSQAKQDNKTEVADLLVKAGAAPLPKASSMVPAETLETYVGAYRNEGGFELQVALTDGQLMLTVPGQPALELSPKDASHFQVVGAGPTTVSFELQDGKVTGMTVRPPETGRVFQKVAKDSAPSEPAPEKTPKPDKKEDLR